MSSGKVTTVQSVTFDKSQWTPRQAKSWLKKHGHTYQEKVDETEHRLRFRQDNPRLYNEYVTKELPGDVGIQLVLGLRPKSAKPKGKPKGKPKSAKLKGKPKGKPKSAKPKGKPKEKPKSVKPKTKPKNAKSKKPKKPKSKGKAKPKNPKK